MSWKNTNGSCLAAYLPLDEIGHVFDEMSSWYDVHGRRAALSCAVRCSVLAVEFDVYFEWLVTGRGPRQFSPFAAEPPAEYRNERKAPDDEAQWLTAFRRPSSLRREALLEFLSRWE